MPLPVLTKRDFVHRYARGEFGNASPTWNDYTEYYRSKYQGLVHIRNRIKGGETWYNVPSSQAGDRWIEACRKVGRENLYISAMAPTDKTVLQGEVQRGIYGLDLTYTRVKRPMREALAVDTRYVSSLGASVILRTYLCQRSFEWLEYLLEAYRDHVIEFSTYSVEWGTVAGYNSVFWEVRKY